MRLLNSLKENLMAHDIQHKHLMIRAEIMESPNAFDGTRLNQETDKMIKDIGMKIALPSRNYFVTDEGNEGWTGQAGLMTSHLTYHFWDNPDPKIMDYTRAKLLQFDLYTCGCLEEKQVAIIQKWVGQFDVKKIELRIEDRASTIFSEKVVKLGVTS